MIVWSCVLKGVVLLVPHKDVHNLFVVHAIERVHLLAWVIVHIGYAITVSGLSSPCIGFLLLVPLVLLPHREVFPVGSLNLLELLCA